MTGEYALKLPQIAAGVFITVGLISLGIYQYYKSADAIKANDEVLTDSAIEWGEADLTSLVSTTRTGTEVLSAVKKYKSDYPVKVITSLSGTDGTVYTASDAVVNEEGTTSYVDPLALFSCELTTNANGVVTMITFTEQIETIVEDSEFTTPDEVKSYLVSELNGLISTSDSWSTIASTLKSDNDQSAKQVLASAVNGSLTDTWYQLASSAAKRIDALEEDVADLNQNASTQHATGSLYGGSSVELSFTPSMIIVWDSHNNMQMYRDSVWSTRNTGSAFENVWCSLEFEADSVVLVNNETEVLQYEAYSY